VKIRARKFKWYIELRVNSPPSMDASLNPSDAKEITSLLETLNEWQLDKFANIFRKQQERIKDLERKASGAGGGAKPNNWETSRLSQFFQTFEKEKDETRKSIERVAKLVFDNSRGMERAYSQQASIQNDVISGLKTLRDSVLGAVGGYNSKDLVIEKLSSVLGAGAIGAKLSPALLNVLLEPWQCQVMNGILGVQLSANHHIDICNAWLPTLRKLQLNALEWDPEKHNETVLVEFRPMPHLEALILNMMLKFPNWKHTVVCGPLNAEMVRDFNVVGLNVIEWPQNITRVSEYSDLLRKNRAFWRQFTGERIILYQEDTWMFNTRWIEAALPYEYCGAPWPLSFGLAPNGVGNGGLSIRSPKAMEKNCGRRADPFPDWISNANVRSRWPRKPNGSWIVPEDIHFCNIKAKQLNIAPFDVARHFALDSYWTTDEYSGGHKWWHCGKGRTNYFHQIRVIDSYWLQSKHDHRCGWFRAIQHLFQMPWLGFTMYGPKVKDEVKMITAIDCYEFHETILEPWIGVLHAPFLASEFFNMNPMLKAQCFNGGNHPMSSKHFGESLALCKRLVVMNADEISHVETWLKKTWGMCPPIDVWTHPIALDVDDGDVKDEYSAESIKDWPIVQLGRQDRIFSEVYTLNTKRRRQWINRLADDSTMEMVKQEAEERGLEIRGEVEILSLNNEEFDKTLLQSVVLIPLWAATANNSVLEIMSLNVPAFVSRLAATEFVLGEDYPMLYSDPSEMEVVLDDQVALADLMTRTREYLKNMDKSRFSLESFAQDAAQTVLRLSV
jgi:hypothetical protein